MSWPNTGFVLMSSQKIALAVTDFSSQDFSGDLSFLVRELSPFLEEGEDMLNQRLSMLIEQFKWTPLVVAVRTTMSPSLKFSKAPIATQGLGLLSKSKE